MLFEVLEGRRLLSANVVATPPEITGPVTAPPAQTPPVITMPLTLNLPSSAHTGKGDHSAGHRKDAAHRQNGDHLRQNGKHLRQNVNHPRQDAEHRPDDATTDAAPADAGQAVGGPNNPIAADVRQNGEHAPQLPPQAHGELVPGIPADPPTDVRQDGQHPLELPSQADDHAVDALLDHPVADDVRQDAEHTPDVVPVGDAGQSQGTDMGAAVRQDAAHRQDTGRH